MSLLSVRNLGFTYADAVVLERLSLEVEAGAFCAIVGASGCGKSTFLRLLLGADRPTAGRILLAGEDIPGEPMPERGIVFQRYSVFPHLTVEENLLLPLELAKSRLCGRLFGARRRRLRRDAGELLERIDLAATRGRYPAQLSGGQQQRLALAQALALWPRILLLDEPFGALDPGIRADMRSLLLELWREHAMTVFMVTHDISEAFALGTRVLVFDKVRHDPQQPSAYGATITYDLPTQQRPGAAMEGAPDVLHS